MVEELPCPKLAPPVAACVAIPGNPGRQSPVAGLLELFLTLLLLGLPASLY